MYVYPMFVYKLSEANVPKPGRVSEATCLMNHSFKLNFKENNKIFIHTK
jgi:hypothetical protein